MQEPPFAGLAQSVEALFHVTVFNVVVYDKRLVKEDLLCLGWGDTVLCIFIFVSLVPVEGGYLFKRTHHDSLYMLNIYTRH